MFLKETKKEKTIRYLLIIFIAIIIIAAFSYRNKNFFPQITTGETNAPLAVVLKKGTDADNPLVALYEQKDDKHLLAIYEIQINNHYFFKTLKAVKLRHPLEAIATDESATGIWIKMSGKWHYLNEWLQEEDRSQETKNPNKKMNYSIKEVKNKKQFILPDGKTVLLHMEEEVKEVHPLTKTNDRWLVITESGVKVFEAFE